ncbi:polymorphic toxin-type HINT domain-containing protein [Chitinophaga sp. S165]|uniref:polymorphic toxin-type HINT domain-containing protein n=1 Tax=Chitinophaga sp. S165 TaxID=2135462 RepID=UPI000D71CF0A|nr:polymorphic toxin-type HINT domain-containing protein [Chitinophaga sp. S165]PWV49709.1 EndoU nuclease-like protein [Chitinophaga sp. S165]
MLRSLYITIVLMLFTGALFAAERKDSLIDEMIEKGREGFKRLSEQNKKNDSLGRSEENGYILNMTTRDGVPEVVVLDKEFIRQRRIIYDKEDPNLVSSFILRDDKTLVDLDQLLRDLNNAPDTKIKTYVLLVDFVPMSFEHSLGKDATLEKLLSKENAGTRSAAIANQALAEARSIIKGITGPMLSGSDNMTLFCGFMKFKVFIKENKTTQFYLYYPHNNIDSDISTNYKDILKSYLSKLAFHNAPQYMEEFIEAVAGNNKDYLNYPAVKDNILKMKTAEEMEALLSKVTDNAYGVFTREQRLYAVKMLAGEPLSSYRGELVAGLLEKTPAEDIDAILDAMSLLNELAPASISFTTLEGEPAESPNMKVGWCLLSQITNNISGSFLGYCEDDVAKRLMESFIKLVNGSSHFEKDVEDYYLDADADKRKIVWDRSYLLSLMTDPPAGINKYDVEHNIKDGGITLTKEQLVEYKYRKGNFISEMVLSSPLVTSILGDAQARTVIESPLLEEFERMVNDSASFLSGLGQYTSSMPVWEKEAPFDLKPLQLVSFVNRSDLSLFSEVSNTGGLQIQMVPAIVLQYAEEKKISKDISKGVEIGFDLITVITPVGELAFLGKTANYIYKTLEYGGKIVAIGNLAKNLEAFPPDSKIAKAITKCYDVCMLLQLTNVGLSLRNGRLAKISRMKTEEFLKSAYDAEADLALYSGKNVPQIEAVKHMRDELELSGEAAGFGKGWYNPLKVGVKRAFSTTISKFKELTGLVQKEEKGILKFLDQKGNQVAHTAADGSLVVDRTGNLVNKGDKIEEIVENAHYRKVEGGAEMTDDLMVIRKADNTIVCKGGSCFVAGTLVKGTAGVKVIETIKENDMVLGVNTATGDTVWQKVTRAFSKQADRLIKIVTAGDTLLSTPEHPYLTAEGWRSAVSIMKGQQLKMAGRLMATVLAVTPMDTSATVYNFETAITHNYCIGNEGVVVHNDCHILQQLMANEDLKEHILKGDLRKQKGVHVIEAVDDIDVRFAPGVTVETNALGVMKGDIEMRKPLLDRGQVVGHRWMPKKTGGEPQTFFPRGWSIDKIMEECASAIRNPAKSNVEGYTRMFRARSDSGVWIRWFEENGVIKSVFPEF